MQSPHDSRRNVGDDHARTFGTKTNTVTVVGHEAETNSANNTASASVVAHQLTPPPTVFAWRTVKMNKAGILILSPIASRRCNTKRMGVTNVFAPSVTG